MKLDKLLHFAHGGHLALTGKPFEHWGVPV